ncbi:MAG: hypothetical protein JSV09_02665 [Thermoplasmata archaeon]|nr:MAG: hypothetical protein JSV09_02665 [Thermoplasmata archaeon]
MSAKVLEMAYKSLLIVVLAVMCFSSFSLAEGYDLTYEDLEGDVIDMEGTKHKVGYDHIDILEISSSENILGTQLILEMTVSGLITDSDDIMYSFIILDGDSMVYMVTYSNGVGTGMGMGDENPEMIQASGSGTNTLEVRIQESDLGDISDFDFSGDAYEDDEANEQFYMDMVPDFDMPDGDPIYYEVPLMITESKPGATVSGTKTISGITDPNYGIVSVEIQFDSKSENVWISTSSDDNWESWSYQWDSTELPDGKHTLNARAFNGTEYYFDSITVYVDQSNAISPRTTDVPDLKIGYEYVYSMDMGMLDDDLFDEDMEMEMTSEMTLKVMKKETINFDGNRYEAYVIDMTISMDMTMTFEGDTISSSITSEGTQYLRVSDLATIGTYTKTSYSSFGMSGSSDSTITYDPPLDSYNFPMSIADTWTSVCIVSTEENFDDEEEPWKDSYESTAEFEALHVENVTIPAGTYETFVIWTIDSSEDYYGGGGTPFFGSTMGYSLNYYSPEIGFPVKAEYYTPTRELVQSMELVSIKEAGSQPGEGPGGYGWEVPIFFLLIPILLAVILGTVIAVRRRRRRAEALDSWQQYTVYPGAPTQSTQPIASHSQVYSSQLQSQVPTARLPPSTVPISRAYQKQPSLSSPPQKATGISPPPPPPGPPKIVRAPVHQVQAAKPYSPPPPPKITNVQRAYPKQKPVMPSMQIKCPKCSSLFFVQKDTIRVQCPSCGTTGKMQW